MADAEYFMKASPEDILRMQLSVRAARQDILAQQLADPRTLDRNQVALDFKAAEESVIAYAMQIAQLRAATEAQERTAQSEDANFWLRRFCTSLAIANAAAFAALAAGFLNTEDKARIASDLSVIMLTFAIGTCGAGLIPGVLWVRGFFRPKPATRTMALFNSTVGGLVGLSTAYFATGMILCIQAVASFA